MTDIASGPTGPQYVPEPGSCLRTELRAKILSAHAARKFLRPTFNATFDPFRAQDVRTVESCIRAISGARLASDRRSSRRVGAVKVSTRSRQWALTEFSDVQDFLAFHELVGLGASYLNRVHGNLVLSKAGDVSFAVPPLTLTYKEKLLGGAGARPTLWSSGS